MRPLLIAVLLVTVALAPAVTGKPPVGANVIYAEGEGHLAAGVLVTGLDVAVGDEPPLNVARFPFDANDCHRHLRFHLDYEPRNASADAAVAYAATPYELEIRLVDAETGERLPNGTMRVLVPGTYGYNLDGPASLVAEVWLRRGADVTYSFRVTGWKDVDAECRHQGWLFVNEVEMGPPADGPQWVELHNARWEDVNLAGWTLRAASGSVLALDDTGSFEADAFTVIDLPPGFLDATGDEVSLVAPRGWEVDVTPRLEDAEADSRTWQRTPDGEEAWEFREETRGVGNSLMVD